MLDRWNNISWDPITSSFLLGLPPSLGPIFQVMFLSACSSFKLFPVFFFFTRFIFITSNWMGFQCESFKREEGERISLVCWHQMLNMHSFFTKVKGRAGQRFTRRSSLNDSKLLKREGRGTSCDSHLAAGREGGGHTNNSACFPSHIYIYVSPPQCHFLCFMLCLTLSPAV